MANTQETPSKGMDWIIFFISTAIMIAMLIYVPAWFWVPLPFVLTYLARAFDAI